MATYLLNILPSKTLAYQSPLKILYQKDPSYSHLWVFDCLCYPLFPSTTINKLQPRSTPSVFLGYPSNHRGYKCYDISSNKIIISHYILFDENQFPLSKLDTLTSSTYDFLNDGLSPHMIHHLHNQTTPQTNVSAQTSHDVAPYEACRPWIFFINGVFCFLNINGNRMEKEERWLETPLQGEDESRKSSPP